jgi:hypothetical protein
MTQQEIIRRYNDAQGIINSGKASKVALKQVGLSHYQYYKAKRCVLASPRDALAAQAQKTAQRPSPAQPEASEARLEAEIRMLRELIADMFIAQQRSKYKPGNLGVPTL